MSAPARIGSGIYVGKVSHTRLRPRRHRLRYAVFSLLIDLTDPAPPRLRLLRRNRPALLSFWDRDHGDGGDDVVAWARALLAEAGLDASDGRILALCYPRLFGYVFNPLTVYFCEGRHGALQAILYEVHNTLGERHTYVAPVRDDARDPRTGVIRQQSEKNFYVSPFIAMACVYDFHITPPGELVQVRIHEHDAEGLLLSASFSGRRKPLSDANLLRALLRHPLMTLKVTGAIYWQALRLLLKRIPWHAHQPAPQRFGHGLAQPPVAQGRSDR